mmetsp:Transcript_42657/g.51226  ORF Transcript_42657/g.51226 Transcript_42657/m.51226 type:complete len:96 (+) Transcript_42657:136-423(+)
MVHTSTAHPSSLSSISRTSTEASSTKTPIKKIPKISKRNVRQREYSATFRSATSAKQPDRGIPGKKRTSTDCGFLGRKREITNLRMNRFSTNLSG